MRTALFLCCSLLLVSCGKDKSQEQMQSAATDEAQIESMVRTMYAGLARAYNEGGVNTDSLFEANYEKDVRYVTAWGSTEPIDSTKARLKNALSHIKDFDHRIESMHVKSYGGAAYAFFILRQQYTVDGSMLDEYLPTTFVLERRGSSWKIVHVQRSTDYETMQQYVSIQQRREAKK